MVTTSRDATEIANSEDHDQTAFLCPHLSVEKLKIIMVALPYTCTLQGIFYLLPQLAQLVVHLGLCSGVRRFDYLFWNILSVTGEKMSTEYWLTA